MVEGGMWEGVLTRVVKEVVERVGEEEGRRVGKYAREWGVK